MTLKAQRGQHHAGQLLRPFADGFSDPGPEPKPGLCHDQRLKAYQGNHENDRKSQQAQREPDRQFVEADADAEPDSRKPARPSKQTHALGRVTILASRPEHEDAQPNQNPNRDVVRGLSRDVPGDGPQYDAGNGHTRLEGREQGRDPHPVAPRQAAHAKGGRDGKRVEPQRHHQGDEREPHPASLDARAGDKATLVVAPLVAAAGIPVAKLSGRALGHSGGTLDKLESIPGFNVDLGIDQFVDQVRRIGIAIAGQTSDMVPADKVFYALRDATATVDSVPLIASSVMSKKLAGGADAIVLDVKCGRGAFVATLDEAEALARALVAIGTNAGRETVAYVTDMEQPLGRAVGNALEVREAIETLAGRGPSDLEALSLRLGSEMLRMASAPPTDIGRLLSGGTALRKFAQLVEAQSGDPRVVDDLSRLPTAPVQRQVAAAESGQVAAIDALEIALAGKSLGAGRDRKDAAIDLAVGIVLQKKVGDAVRQGPEPSSRRNRLRPALPGRFGWRHPRGLDPCCCDGSVRRVLSDSTRNAGSNARTDAGGLDPGRATVRVKGGSPTPEGRPVAFTLALTYRDPVTSPLRRSWVRPSRAPAKPPSSASKPRKLTSAMGDLQ